jgi:pilus assembly protein CpaF
MFTIVISEKGGAERRETFDKNEINVGRVQGNDLTLAKGNVSKHHARLLYRDARFIVTDLKSTNGTYVNGRKISQATIVREGDKIYIGDFVLRLETGQKDGVASADSTYADNDVLARGSASVHAERPALPAPVPPPRPAPGPPNAPEFQAMAAAPSSSLPARSSDPDGVGHFPLERDPDEPESSATRAAPAPKAARPAARAPSQADARGRSTVALVGERAPPPQRTAPPAGSPPALRSRSVPPPPVRAALRETPDQAARRLALITLVDRVADLIDLAALERSPVVVEGVSQSLERAVREQAKAMRVEGEAPDGIDLELLEREALGELVGLGAIGPLLEDDETSEIHVVRPDYVLASKNGQMSLAELSFTSEEALGRVIARLAHQSGDPLRVGELVIDRRLPRGASMTAVAPPAANGWVLHVRKRRRVEASLEGLVRSDVLTESIATFLAACAAARLNVLVVGSGAGTVALVLCAIAAAALPGERVAVLQRGADEIALPQAHVIPLALSDHGLQGAESVHVAARLGVDRMVIPSIGGAVAAAAIDVIAEGSEGVLAGIGAPSLRHALARLVAQVAAARAGSSVEAAREAVGASFDLAVVVTKSDGDRIRVVRIAELDGSDDRAIVTRDLFVLNANGAGEGSYVTTGLSPRMAHDLAARGVSLDGLPKRV